MLKLQSIYVIIKFNENEKYIELPLDYNVFLNNICIIFLIPKELINNIQLSYKNDCDSKIYFIKNAVNYALFLKACKEQKTKIISMDLINEIDNNEAKGKKENKLNQDNIILFIEQENQIKDKNYKNQKESFKLNNNINDIDDNINNNFNITYDIININNQVNFDKNKNGEKTIFNFFCNICKGNKTSEIIYYCMDCKIFFCKQCEVNRGKKEKHCYYKIRTQTQFKELKTRLNRIGIKFDNMNKINRNIINNKINLTESLKEVINIGCKKVGDIGKNLKNIFDNYNNQNIYSNEFNNPYEINYMENQNDNNDDHIPDEEELKLLVREARTTYNLSTFNEIAIESALIQNKGNIQNAARMLIDNK